MPPPGGPLIGSRTKAMIAEAAAAADMEHRDFINMNDGSFLKTWTDGGTQPDVYKITVRDGSVEVEKIASGYLAGSGADDPPTVSDFTHLQADVFDYWRDEIQSQVVSLINNTADELDDAAAALREAARQIGLSDEQSNLASRNLADQINRDNVNV